MIRWLRNIKSGHLVWLPIFVTLYGLITFFLFFSFKHTQVSDATRTPTLQQLLGCLERETAPRFEQRGDYQVLYNYVQAEERSGCADGVTYTTHGDHKFLDNLAPLIERWRGPVSMSVFAPGADWAPAVAAIQHVRHCGPKAHLVRRWLTFHLYFPKQHAPKKFLRLVADDEGHLPAANCSQTLEAAAVLDQPITYKSTHKLLYPVNVGRNVAREEARTHFVFASDVELYPNPGFVADFLDMIFRHLSHGGNVTKARRPKVYPLSVFEIRANASVPENKTQLVQMLKNNQAIRFHKNVCSKCHAMPKAAEWMALPQSVGLNVFHVEQRTGSFYHWEPLYVGTHADPIYDERLSWEGRSDKMTQGYAMCVLNYEFHILDNAFLVHRAGIKIYHKGKDRDVFENRTNVLIKQKILNTLGNNLIFILTC